MEGTPELRFTVPPSLLEVSKREPRFVLRPIPGLMPVDFALLTPDFIEKLAGDKEFNANFEILIVPK